MCLQFRFVIFWQKELGAKAACKMLVKLTTGLWSAYTYSCPRDWPVGRLKQPLIAQLIRPRMWETEKTKSELVWMTNYCFLLTWLQVSLVVCCWYFCFVSSKVSFSKMHVQWRFTVSLDCHCHVIFASVVEIPFIPIQAKYYFIFWHFIRRSILFALFIFFVTKNLVKFGNRSLVSNCSCQVV